MVMDRHFARFAAISPLRDSTVVLKNRRATKDATMPATPAVFASIALVGNDRDTRVVESMQILAVHLHSRGRKVFAESDSTVDFGADARRAAARREAGGRGEPGGRDRRRRHDAARRAARIPARSAGARRESRPARLPRRHRPAGRARPARRDPRRPLRAGQARDAHRNADCRQRRAHRSGAERRRAAEVADRPHARLRNLDRRPLRQHAPRATASWSQPRPARLPTLSAAAARFSIRSSMRWCSRRSARTRCRTGPSWSAAPRRWRSDCWNAWKRRRR